LKNEITITKFRKFLYEGRLTRPKTKVAKHFGISTKTLYRWMRKTGYGYLIGPQNGAIPKPPKKGEVILSAKELEKLKDSEPDEAPKAPEFDKEEAEKSDRVEILPDDFEFELEEDSK